VLKAKTSIVINDTMEQCDAPVPPAVAETGIRFYAGWPLVTPSGTIVGVFSICDTKPRLLSPLEQKVLQALAKVVIDHLETLKANDSLQQLSQSLAAARESAEASELALRTAIESLDQGFVIQDSEGLVTVANQAACEMLGLTLDQLKGRSSIDPRWRSIHEDGSDYPGEEHPAMRVLRTGLPVSGDVMGVHRPNGELVWIEIRSRPLIRPGANKPHGAVTMFSNITEARQLQISIEQEMIRVNEMNIALELQSMELEEQNSNLSRLAMTDGLTELANRRHFQEALTIAFADTQAAGRPLSLMMLDVDNFKSFNDTFGHPEGDKVLKLVAKTLTRVLPPEALAARYGGEEFAVLLPGWELDQAAWLAESIRRAVEEAPTDHRRMSASFGIAGRDARDRAPIELVIRADGALYRAKKLGRNRVETSGIELPSAAA
jgi:diguanylate cyclase (GGDEF)-like protein/PAS domain S-box-containing protein